MHFFWYKPHPTDHRRYVKDNIEAWLFWAAANLSISWFLALIIDVVPTLIRFFIVLSWGHVSEVVKNNIVLYSSVKENIKPLFYAASSWVSWVILFEHVFPLYNPDEESASLASYTPRVRITCRLYHLLWSIYLCSPSFRFIRRSNSYSSLLWSFAHSECFHMRSVRSCAKSILPQ